MSAFVVAVPQCVPIGHIVRILLKLAEIVLAGAFGGVANAVSILFEGGRTENAGVSNWEAARGVPTRRYLLGQAAVGAGGAFAAVFGMLTIGNAVQAGAAKDITDFPIYLASLCVVGGFIGNKLLAGVSKKLLDQIAAAKEEAKQAKATAHDAKELASGSSQSAKTATTVAGEARATASEAKAEAVQTRGFLSQFDKVMLDITSGKEIDQKLEDLFEKGQRADDELRAQATDVLRRLDDYARSMTHSRALAIVRANLNFDLGLVDEAFAVLEAFVADRRSAAVPEDDDDAAAWFNIACYSAVLSRAAQNGERSRLLTKARDALGESLRVDAGLGPEAQASRVYKAQTDDDLDALRATKMFAPVLAPFLGTPSDAIVGGNNAAGEKQSLAPAAQLSPEENSRGTEAAAEADTTGEGKHEDAQPDEGSASDHGDGA